MKKYKKNIICLGLVFGLTFGAYGCADISLSDKETDEDTDAKISEEEEESDKSEEASSDNKLKTSSVNDDVTEQDEDKDEAEDKDKAEDEDEDDVASADDSPLWVLGEDDYAENASFIQYDQDAVINIYTGENDDGQYAGIRVDVGGVEGSGTVLNILDYSSDKMDYYSFLNIYEVGVADCNFDGRDDVIIVGETKLGMKVGICEYEKKEYEADSFLLNDYFSENMTEKLADDISVSGVINSIYGESYNGSFETYQEAFLSVLDMSLLRYGEEDIYYDLIYFNDDDIPELVVDHTGYYVSMYLYEDGKLYCPILDWGYGAGGNGGYEFVERTATVVNFNTDYAGMIYWNSYLIMDSNHEIVGTYAIKGYNFDDLNGNDYPDDDECTPEALENAEGKEIYYCYTDEDMTEEEIKEKISEIDKGERGFIGGNLTLEEVTKKLT